MIPARYKNLDAARTRFGDRVDRLAPFLFRLDPLADAVIEEMEALPKGRGWAAFNDALRRPSAGDATDLPPAIRALFAEVERVPLWVDWSVLDRGGELLLRSGALGGIVLGAASLVYGYASPGGNKPLVFSGQLLDRAVRRLNETARFVHETARRGGLRRRGEGFAITLKVRLMHARVRYMLRRSPVWRNDLWGEPINQHDMAATTLLFSLVFLRGVRDLGLDVSRDEAESFMQLWRYSGHLIGVDPELLPTSEFEAQNLAELIRTTEGDPDDDSRALVRALFDAPVREARTPERKRLASLYQRLGYGFCRVLIGDELADGLAVPRTNLTYFSRVVRAVAAVTEGARVRSPEAQRAAVSAGERYWARAVEAGLASSAVAFTPPERLAHVA
jgi:hypothetical protein